MLTFTNLALRRGTELLFEDVSFTIHRGQKVGLIGANGAGKTSLFAMLTGDLEPDRGSFDYPADTRIAWLEQEVPATAQHAIDYVLSGDEHLIAIRDEIAKIEQEERYEHLAELHEQMAAIDGYSARARGEQLMVGLGFAHDDFEKPLGDFSGGWRVRLNLAKTLMAPSDLLLLDEPTNHLDLDAIIWLSDWIKHYQGTLVLISHDREFLDETVGSILYLYRRHIELVSGNYSQFERIKAERLAEQQSNYEKQQREIKHMQDFVRRFRAKATKARQAQSRIKALARMELIAPAHIDSPFRFEIPTARKISDPLLALDQAVLGYGELRVLEEVRLSLHPGDRIGLLGHNGAGKSTLVKSLQGELPLIAGNRVEGHNLAIGYFSQHQVDDLELDKSAMAHIRALDDKVTEQQIRDFLGGFDFHGDKVKDPVRTFSGGEKARLALAVVAFSKPNLLLMDEPTNHLDMDMRQALTVALQDYDGAVVLISHDRHLLANTVDQFLLIDQGQVQRFDGDLEDYRRRLLGQTGSLVKPEPETPAKTKSARQQRSKPRPQKGNHRQARQLRTRLSTIEQRLTRLHRKLEEVECALSDPSAYEDGAADLQSLLREQIGLKDEIKTLEEDWLDKSTALERLG